MSGTDTATRSKPKRYLVKVDTRGLAAASKKSLRKAKGSEEIPIPGKDIREADIDVGDGIQLLEMSEAELQKFQEQVTVPGQLPSETMEWQEVTTTPAVTEGLKIKYGHGGVAEYAAHVKLKGPAAQRDGFLQILKADPQIQHLLRGREKEVASWFFEDADRLAFMCDNQHDAFILKARVDQLLIEHKHNFNKISVATEVSPPLHVHALPVTEIERRELSLWAQEQIGSAAQNVLTIGVSSPIGETWMDAAYAWLGVSDSGLMLAAGDTGARLGHAAFYSNDALSITCAVSTISDPSCPSTSYAGVAAAGDSAARPNDDGHGHGTWVLSEMVSSAKDALIIDLQVFFPNGSGSTIAVLNALKQFLQLVKDNPDKELVLNLSLQWAGDPQGINSQIQAVLNQLNTYENCLVVVAAGNDAMKMEGPSTCVYPACFQGVIPIGSYSTNLQESSFSNFGSKVLLTAPGGGNAMIGASTSGSVTAMTWMQGTSMAAPNVAGRLAKFKPIFKRLFPGLKKADFLKLVYAIAENPANVQYFDWNSAAGASPDLHLIQNPLFNLDLFNVIAFINSPAGARYKAAMPAGALDWLVAEAQSRQLASVPKTDASGTAASNDYLLHNPSAKPLSVGATTSFAIDLGNVQSGAFLSFGATSTDLVPAGGLDSFSDSGYAPSLMPYHGLVYTSVYMKPSQLGNIPISRNGQYTVSVVRKTAQVVWVTVTGPAGIVPGFENKAITLQGTGTVADLRAQLRVHNCQVTGFEGTTLGHTAAPAAAPSSAASTSSPARPPAPRPSRIPPTRPPHLPPTIARRTPNPSPAPTPGSTTALPTGAPVPRPTRAPVPGPTRPPVRPPTTKLRTPAPVRTRGPTPAATTPLPTSAPVTPQPTPLPTPAPIARITKSPTAPPSRRAPPTAKHPTSKPTSVTTLTPTFAPVPAPTSVAPSPAPTTAAPSAHPTLAPTTASPTYSPGSIAEPVSYCSLTRVSPAMLAAIKSAVTGGELYLATAGRQFFITQTQAMMADMDGNILVSQPIIPPLTWNQMTYIKTSNNNNQFSISVFNAGQTKAQSIFSVDFSQLVNTKGEYEKPSDIKITYPSSYNVQLRGTVTQLCSKPFNPTPGIPLGRRLRGATEAAEGFPITPSPVDQLLIQEFLTSETATAADVAALNARLETIKEAYETAATTSTEAGLVAASRHLSDPAADALGLPTRDARGLAELPGTAVAPRTTGVTPHPSDDAVVGAVQLLLHTGFSWLNKKLRATATSGARETGGELKSSSEALPVEEAMVAFAKVKRPVQFNPYEGMTDAERAAAAAETGEIIESVDKHFKGPGGGYTA